MRLASRKSRCSFFKRHWGLLMSAILATSACQGFCMLGGGVSSRIKCGFRFGTGGGRVTQKATHRQVPDRAEPAEPGVWDTDSLAKARNRALQWLTGGGDVSEEDVRKAQSKVEQKGGTIVSNADVGASGLVDIVGCDLEHWDDVVDGIGRELGLGDEPKGNLRNTKFMNEQGGAYFRDKVNCGARTTTYTAFRTVRDETRQKMHVIYGQHSLSLSLSLDLSAEETETAMGPGVATDVEERYCTYYAGRTFSVLPPACPFTQGLGEEMVDQWFGIPKGWRVWDASADKQAEEVVRHVIKIPSWNVDRVLGKQGENFASWGTAMEEFLAGRQLCPSVDYLTYEPVQGLYCFSEEGRLLIEKAPRASEVPRTNLSFELQQDWLRFVRLSAQAEWSSRLGCLRQATATPGEVVP